MKNNEVNTSINQKQRSIDMRYQHINKTGKLMTGNCHSKPEILENGKEKLYES